METWQQSSDGVEPVSETLSRLAFVFTFCYFFFWNIVQIHVCCFKNKCKEVYEPEVYEAPPPNVLKANQFTELEECLAYVFTFFF